MDIIDLKFVLMFLKKYLVLRYKNYQKSKVIFMRESIEMQHLVENMLNCKLGLFSIIYFSLPFSDKHIMIEQWNFLVLKLAGRVEPWIGKKILWGEVDSL
jgi:hypothetical protein